MTNPDPGTRLNKNKKSGSKTMTVKYNKTTPTKDIMVDEESETARKKSTKERVRFSEIDTAEIEPANTDQPITRSLNSQIIKTKGDLEKINDSDKNYQTMGKTVDGPKRLVSMVSSSADGMFMVNNQVYCRLEHIINLQQKIEDSGGGNIHLNRTSSNSSQITSTMIEGKDINHSKMKATEGADIFETFTKSQSMFEEKTQKILKERFGGDDCNFSSSMEIRKHSSNGCSSKRHRAKKYSEKRLLFKELKKQLRDIEQNGDSVTLEEAQEKNMTSCTRVGEYGESVGIDRLIKMIDSPVYIQGQHNIVEIETSENSGMKKLHICNSESQVYPGTKFCSQKHSDIPNCQTEKTAEIEHFKCPFSLNQVTEPSQENLGCNEIDNQEIPVCHESMVISQESKQNIKIGNNDPLSADLGTILTKKYLPDLPENRAENAIVQHEHNQQQNLDEYRETNMNEVVGLLNPNSQHFFINEDYKNAITETQNTDTVDYMIDNADMDTPLADGRAGSTNKSCTQDNMATGPSVHGESSNCQELNQNLKCRQRTTDKRTSSVDCHSLISLSYHSVWKESFCFERDRKLPTNQPDWRQIGNILKNIGASSFVGNRQFGSDQTTRAPDQGDHEIYNCPKSEFEQHKYTRFEYVKANVQKLVKCYKDLDDKQRLNVYRLLICLFTLMLLTHYFVNISDNKQHNRTITMREFEIDDLTIDKEHLSTNDGFVEKEEWNTNVERENLDIETEDIPNKHYDDPNDMSMTKNGKLNHGDSNKPLTNIDNTQSDEQHDSDKNIQNQVKNKNLDTEEDTYGEDDDMPSSETADDNHSPSEVKGGKKENMQNMGYPNSDTIGYFKSVIKSKTKSFLTSITESYTIIQTPPVLDKDLPGTVKQKCGFLGMFFNKKCSYVAPVE